MKIVSATQEHIPVWREFRDKLFGEVSSEITAFDIDRILNSPDQQCLIAFQSDQPIGFAEMVLRNLVDGCCTSPVGYLEAIYVDPKHRGNGVGRLLLHSAEKWAIEQGCSEFGTDSALDDLPAQDFHVYMGFRETNRSVQYRKPLPKQT